MSVCLCVTWRVQVPVPVEKPVETERKRKKGQCHLLPLASLILVFSLFPLFHSHFLFPPLSRPSSPQTLFFLSFICLQQPALLSAFWILAILYRPYSHLFSLSVRGSITRHNGKCGANICSIQFVCLLIGTCTQKCHLMAAHSGAESADNEAHLICTKLRFDVWCT